MDIWIKRVSRATKCAHCPDVIDKGSFMVVGKSWWKTKSGKHWSVLLHWHTNCWIKQGIEAIEYKERTEPRIETRGRKKSDIPESVKPIRLKIMRRRAAVIQRIKALTAKNDGSKDFDKIAHLGDLLEKYRTEISNAGGVPATWENHEYKVPEE